MSGKRGRQRERDLISISQARFIATPQQNEGIQEYGERERKKQSEKEEGGVTEYGEGECKGRV